jgi:hypothetical protein
MATLSVPDLISQLALELRPAFAEPEQLPSEKAEVMRLDEGTLPWAIGAVDLPLPPIDGDVEELRGTDLLAFYRSFHFDPKRWGVFLREFGVLWLAQRLGGGWRAIEAAARCLFCHEYFHFLTDLAATVIELAVRRPRYVPYVRSSHSHSLVEEGLANAFAVQRDSGDYDLQERLHQFMRRQPPGYRDYGHHLDKGGWPSGLRRLAGDLAGLPGPAEPILGGELLFDHGERVVGYGSVPVYVVLDAHLEAPVPPSADLIRQGLFRPVPVYPYV